MKLREPFFRSQKQSWYVWIGDRMKSLGVKGEDAESAAYQAWHRLLGGITPTEATEIAVETPTKATGNVTKTLPEGVTLGVVLQSYLDHAKHHCAAATYRNYRIFLNPIIAQHGERAASDIQEDAVKKWMSNEWSASYRHYFLGTIISAFRHSVKVKLLTSNPLARIIHQR